MTVPPTPMLDALLDETRRLLVSAQHVVGWVDGGLRSIDDAELRLLITRDCSRLTARLTAVLSWLLAQKAVMHGEIAPDDERACRRLFGVGDPRVDPADLGNEIDRPDELSRLLRESATLFARVARLDGLAGGRS
ncbi:MAG: DUF1465 family protein [Solirubrobacterales bacterium]